MAAIDFPASPALNQLFVAGNGVTYKWNGTLWIATSSSGGASITVSDTPPAGPVAGALWWNSVLGAMFIYFNDGNTSQWVPASPTPSFSLRTKTTSFTAGGTFTPDANLVHGYAVGTAGGGGGGSASVQPTQTNGACGGASGNVVMATFTASQVSPSVAVTIGAGGFSALVGGDTIFGSLLTAKGGGAGSQYSPGTANASGNVGIIVSYGVTGGVGAQGTTSQTAASGSGGGPGAGAGAMAGGVAYAIGTNGLPNSGGGGGGAVSSQSGPGTIGGGTGGSGNLYVVEYVRA